MHTADESSQQRSPTMTLHSETELARSPYQGQVLSHQPLFAYRQATKVKPWKHMSCKSQVLREHCAGQVIQQLNKMSPWLDVLSTPVWHTCRATVQLGQQLTRPFRQSYGLFYGFKLSFQPNYVKKKHPKKHIFYLPLLVSSHSKK